MGVDCHLIAANDGVCVRTSQLTMVDMTGAEKLRFQVLCEDAQQEVIALNTSVEKFGNVIDALAAQARHVPYCDSTLAQLLQASLGGSVRTVIVTTFGPTENTAAETLATLRFAERARGITNFPSEAPFHPEAHDML